MRGRSFRDVARRACTAGEHAQQRSLLEARFGLVLDRAARMKRAAAGWIDRTRRLAGQRDAAVSLDGIERRHGRQQRLGIGMCGASIQRRADSCARNRGGVPIRADVFRPKYFERAKHDRNNDASTSATPASSAVQQKCTATTRPHHKKKVISGCTATPAYHTCTVQVQVLATPLPEALPGTRPQPRLPTRCPPRESLSVRNVGTADSTRRRRNRRTGVRGESYGESIWKFYCRI